MPASNDDWRIGNIHAVTGAWFSSLRVQVSDEELEVHGPERNKVSLVVRCKEKRGSDLTGPENEPNYGKGAKASIN
jgi:hypothetical protein